MAITASVQFFIKYKYIIYYIHLCVNINFRFYPVFSAM